MKTKILLTPPAVARLKRDPHKRQEIRDLGTAAPLYLLIQPSGKKSWAMRFRRPGGKWGKLVLGPVDPKEITEEGKLVAPVIGQPHTLAAAREHAAKINRERTHGKRDVIAEHKAGRSRQQAESEQVAASTFGLLARQFVEEHARPKTRRWRETARNLGLIYPADEGEPVTAASGGLAERWADKPVTTIDGHDIHGVVKEATDQGIPGLRRRKRNEGASDARGRKIARTLSKFFNWVMKQERKITSNPCVSVYCPPPPKSRDRVLSDNEIRWFWQAAESLGPPFGPLLKILLLTGQRRGEVSGMRRDELQEADEWHLPGSRTKNKLEHIVPLTPLALELIGSEGYPFVFSTTGDRPVSSWSKTKARLDRAILALAKKEKATIAPWVLHDLRRTAVTNMNKIAIPPHVVEAVVNHVSGAKAGVAGAYNKYAYLPEKKDALRRWTMHVQGLVGDKASNVVDIKKRKRR